MTFHNRLKLFSFAFVFALFTLLQRHHPLDPLAVRSVAHTRVRRESTEPVHTHIHRGIIPQLCLYLYCWSRYTGHTIKMLYATSTLCTHNPSCCNLLLFTHSSYDTVSSIDTSIICKEVHA